MKTTHALFSALVVLSSLTITTLCVQVSPSHRQKRSGISDQRLAELETMLTLSKMRGKMVTVPVAFGVIDPDKIGKRSGLDSDNRDEILPSRLFRSLRNFRSRLDSEDIERSDEA